MGCELTEDDAIKPTLPIEPRDAVARSVKCFGPYTTATIAFVRWRRVGVWATIRSARVAARHDELAANCLAFIQLASIRLWLRINELTS
jgi:transposase